MLVTPDGDFPLNCHEFVSRVCQNEVRQRCLDNIKGLHVVSCISAQTPVGLVSTTCRRLFQFSDILILLSSLIF